MLIKATLINIGNSKNPIEKYYKIAVNLTKIINDNKYVT
jgi:hypothetical protein